MGLNDLTRLAVDQALAEFDQRGRKAFLRKYGFGEARSYVVEIGTSRYDSKAIAGAAHGYLPGRQPLASEDFSGGENTVATALRGLGYTVSSNSVAARNPPWSRDELILALDLYMQNPASPPGKSSAPILELSTLLGRMASLLGWATEADHRNPNGVYMKVMNFRRFDPSFRTEGKVGLSHGAKEDEVVWNIYANDPEKLSKVASGIRMALQGDQDHLGLGLDDVFVTEAIEGRLLTVTHLARERDRRLISGKKKHVLAHHGELRCECCGLAFPERYGRIGEGFIEVHHTKPVHTLSPTGEKTRLEDLALVCANCHRMIHRATPWLSIDQLKSRLMNPLKQPVDRDFSL